MHMSDRERKNRKVHAILVRIARGLHAHDPAILEQKKRQGCKRALTVQASPGAYAVEFPRSALIARGLVTCASVSDAVNTTRPSDARGNARRSRGHKPAGYRPVVPISAKAEPNIRFGVRQAI